MGNWGYNPYKWSYNPTFCSSSEKVTHLLKKNHLTERRKVLQQELKQNINIKRRLHIICWMSFTIDYTKKICLTSNP